MILLEGMVLEEVVDLDRSHLVVYQHRPTGVISYQDPYPDALTATVAARTELEAVLGTDEEGEVTCVVAPIRAGDPTPQPKSALRPRKHRRADS